MMNDEVPPVPENKTPKGSKTIIIDHKKYILSLFVTVKIEFGKINSNNILDFEIT